VPDLKAKVTKVVLKILNDEERRGLADLDALRKKIYSFAVQITGMTEEECAEKYSKDVLCHKATVMIESKEAFKERFSILKDLLGNVLDAHGIVLYSNKGGYPYVTITNKTPYNMVGFRHPPESRNVVYLGFPFCSPDEILDGIAAGQTWSATSRGVCLVESIDAYLLGSTQLMKCDSYKSSGTSYSQFYIIMNGENACCVQSSHGSGVCGPSGPSTDCTFCGDRSYCCHYNGSSGGSHSGGWNSDCPGCASSF